MATVKNNKQQKNSKTTPIKTKLNKNTIIMKTLTFLGVIIFCFILIYLMYYFFVTESDIKINMSTDKKLEYVTIEGNEELIATQKYVSDLNYTMRYDINNFKIFKYKNQDIYKNLKDERVLVVVERSTLPTNCAITTSQNEYNNCYIKIDDYTEEHYISTSSVVYKITIKTPGTTEYKEGIEKRINYMLDSFSIVKK